MRLMKALFSLVCAAALFSPSALADRLDFTVTITTNYYPPYGVVYPIGSQYHGYATYHGSIDPNSSDPLPAITSFYFDFPPAPGSLDDYYSASLAKNYEVPVSLFMAYYPDTRATAFRLYGTSFYEWPFEPGVDGQAPGEGGVVTYSVTADPPTSPVPEPGTLALIATGAIALFAGLKRRTLNTIIPSER